LDPGWPHVGEPLRRLVRLPPGIDNRISQPRGSRIVAAAAPIPVEYEPNAATLESERSTNGATTRAACLAAGYPASSRQAPWLSRSWRVPPRCWCSQPYPLDDDDRCRALTLGLGQSAAATGGGARHANWSRRASPACGPSSEISSTQCLHGCGALVSQLTRRVCVRPGGRSSATSRSRQRGSRTHRHPKARPCCARGTGGIVVAESQFGQPMRGLHDEMGYDPLQVDAGDP
jgi:hypothetical protein